LCHLVYRYIFCLPSRRSRQITVRALEIIYSFCSFVCSSSSLIWQHVPDSSFSLVCILQHLVSSIDILHIPHVHNSYNYKHHTYHHVLLKNSGNYSYNFYTLSFLSGNPCANHLINLVHGQQIIFHIFLIILGLLNIIEESIRIFCFPFTRIFYIPCSCLYFPVKWNFILNRKRWDTPD